MKTLARLTFVALILLGASAACTPSGAAGFTPATRTNAPMDTGGGLPPGPTAPTPTP